MVEDKVEPRELNFRQMFPWTVLFRGFQVALDPKKLLLAGAGIVLMASGWWLLAFIFFNSWTTKPMPGDYVASNYSSDTDPAGEAEANNRTRAWAHFKMDRRKWNLLHEAAGPAPVRVDAGDLAETPEQYAEINKMLAAGERTILINGEPAEVGYKPYGRLRTWPWFEDRGPNPFLLATGQVPRPAVRQELRVLLEPLVKLLQPVVYLLTPGAGLLNRFYFLLVTLWTVSTWAFIGGALTRMAVVQIARNEKISLGEALRFVWTRKWSYVFASVFPFIIIGAMVALLWLFGIGNWIPIFAEFWNGLLWPLVLLAGIAMAVVLVGLVGWPMIHATLSAEGSDSFDALSRSYSYVYQNPWNYLFYSAVAIAYGAVVVFFVGLMGSLMVYLGKWAVAQTPLTQTFNRDPSYMFILAPESFGWRQLLLEGKSYAGTTLYWWNWIGITLMTFWLWLVFLMIVGFGYSFFWAESSIIYLLMRRKVDDTELDEVYLEEEEPEDAYTSTAAATPSALTPPSTPGMTMVEPPSLRPATGTAGSVPSSPTPEPAGSELAGVSGPAQSASSSGNTSSTSSSGVEGGATPGNS